MRQLYMYIATVRSTLDLGLVTILSTAALSWIKQWWHLTKTQAVQIVQQYYNMDPMFQPKLLLCNVYLGWLGWYCFRSPFPVTYIILTLATSRKMSSTMKVRSWETRIWAAATQLMAISGNQLNVGVSIISLLSFVVFFSKKSTYWRKSDGFQTCCFSMLLFPIFFGTTFRSPITSATQN